MSPIVRVRLAWAMLAVCVVAWPVTSFTVFRSEPQAVLALSWVAIIQAALLLIVTTDVRREQDGDED